MAQDATHRARCTYRTQARCNKVLSHSGPVPSGWAPKDTMRPCFIYLGSSFIWNDQTSLLAPSLVSFGAPTQRLNDC